MNQKETTYTHLFTDDLKTLFNNRKNPNKKIYAVMEFNTEFELGISCQPYKWVNSSTIVTLNGQKALWLYMNNKNPMTELITAKSFNELNNKMIKMANNFKNPEFVNNKVEARFY